ncbi:MAG TPA: type III pantothenate kinase [Flavobacterium sp.]|jgi:type III pantothenate kinase
MILTVDIGNSRIKAAVFEHTTAIQLFELDKTALHKNLSDIINQHPAISDIVVSNVACDVRDAFSAFESKVRIFYINRNGNFPFTNNYSTPATLGIDRMLLAAGAVLQYPKQHRLIIDAGTCITYDFVDQQDVYHGGAISPGLRLRYESLHNFTANLPLLNPEAPTHFIGDSTTASIHSGIVNGITNEIDGFIDSYRAEYPNFIIILTGGNAEFLANRLKNTIFANSIFLLESLNQTFLYQSKND